MIHNRIIYKLFTSILIVSFLLGCAARDLSYGRRGKGVYHTVKKGQTVWRIAKTYGINIRPLMRINHLSDPKDLKVGQRLFIPGAKRVLGVKVYALPDKKRRTAINEKQRSYRAKDVFFKWPVKGKVTSLFGFRSRRKHDGVDIAAPGGTPIKTAADGKVIFSGWGPTGYGRIVIVKHTRDFVTVYAHNRKNLVYKNQYVKSGQKIAEVGASGRTTGPHLHFEIRLKRISVDPIRYLPIL